MQATGDRAIVTSVRIRCAAALMVAAGLLIVPLVALYCDEGDAASMACCKGDMAGCNQPGKTEDCCRKGVASRENALNLVKASRLDKPAAVSLPDFALTAATPPAAVLVPASVVAASHLVPPGAPSPPLTSVLRL